MNPILGVFVRDGVFLLTHQKEARSKGIIETSLEALQQKPYMTSAIQALRKTMVDVVLVPLFDYHQDTSHIRRRFRFVHRTGQASFPDWLPAELSSGVVIYNAPMNCAPEIAIAYPSWVGRCPRVSRFLRRTRRRLISDGPISREDSIYFT